MLKQFNVYRNSSNITNRQLPYYMIIQHDCYDDFDTRVIVPLIRARKLPLWHEHIAPRINIDFENLLIFAPMVTNINNAKINNRDYICNLRNARQDVVAAIDALVTNT
ncbi:CcdB family protein [Leclercia adecarboxylata]|uniref:CcdB family protein n=1 Tax=Leclercia adecarboxylata TaxID=83655 RepID=UPI002DBC1CEC|nr:CcdB family protein [Leclercia adecarboxylata]MEB6377695.1 CcdB family protein [Leclercia adecarboxylata]